VTEKTLPEIYREAADLVLKHGKAEGKMKRTYPDVLGDPKCCGFCTMGAVLEAAGLMDDRGNFKPGYEEFDYTPDFLRLVGPIADQLKRSDRSLVLDHGNKINAAYWGIANWNDGSQKPTAEDVAQLLRETADAVEAA
jgi:hypothetical protein